MRKIIIYSTIFFIVVILVGLSYGGYLLSKKDIFGWRFNFSFNKVETSDYKNIAPNLKFKYPNIFEIDNDKEQRYGKGYLTGIKLRTDNRTGCDIRTNGPQIDFSKSDQEITDSVISQIKDKAKDFKLIENGKITIGGRDAFKTSFSFLDPIGARVRLDQVFAQNENTNFFIICGTGEYQYDFFKKDFQVFYDSISFDSDLSGLSKK